VVIAKVLARSEALKWVFITFILTVLLGISAIVYLDATGKDLNAPREIVLALFTGQLGLMSGLLAARD